MIETRSFFTGTAFTPVNFVRLSIPVAPGKIQEAMELLLSMKFKGWDMIELYETQDDLPSVRQAISQIEIPASDPSLLLMEVNKWAIEQGYFTSRNTSKGRFRIRIPNLLGIEFEFVKEG